MGRYNEISEQIIGAAIEVHRALGPGLLESAYEECVAYELKLRGLHFQRQIPLPVIYKAVKMECGYRMDFVVKHLIVLELKTVEKILPIHEAQLLTYLKLTDIRLGLLLNFNVPVLKESIKRLPTSSKIPNLKLKNSLRLRVSAV